MLPVKSVGFALAGVLLVLGGGEIASAQAGDTSIFTPLTLGPAPSSTRLANGAPGPKYWQNRADYDLKGVLDTTTKTITGSMTLRYTNNSPDTLHVLWIQTEQDPDERIDRFVQLVNGAFVPVKVEQQEQTETKVTLAAPIKPGTMATFQVSWQFNKFHGGRMGRAGESGVGGRLYAIAQWYPRVNVYDDAKGWNTEPYTTGAEFYLEYGDYTMEVTVPAGYIVAATGTLDNPTEVLTPAEISRLAVAAKSDSVVHIVTTQELESGAARPATQGVLTWKFHAKNVRDAVWCASPDYRWDATSWHNILAQSYYTPKSASVWEDAADQARMSIQEYSERWLPYPYPQVTVAIANVGGMEYPMLSMNPMAETKPRLYSTLTHEVGHNWFPMIVGSNERVHTWQDEGFNQFINTFSDARRYPEQDQSMRAQVYVSRLAANVASGSNGPLETGEVIGNAADQYFKTAAVLQMLRRDVLGPEIFDKGLKIYVQRWAYKHPTPVDFFRTMSDVAGRNLDWYWREWFLEPIRFNQTIDSVSQTAQGSETKVTVIYGNKERGVLPLLVRFTFSDSTTQDFTYPAEVWKTHGSAYSVSYTFAGKTVKKVELDPDAHLANGPRTDDVWIAK